MPFFTEGYEGFDVNHPFEWQLAEELVRTGQAKLPRIAKPPYKTDG
jgi:N-acylneuraminate cytidylyltransferase